MHKYNQIKIIILCKTIFNMDEECTFYLHLNKKYDFVPRKKTNYWPSNSSSCHFQLSLLTPIVYYHCCVVHRQNKNRELFHKNPCKGMHISICE